MSAESPSLTPRRGHVPNYRFPAFLAVWIPHVLLVWRFWFIVDDAFISFRYARNFANGLGLRFNLGEHVPVEGYSNFLWVIVCSAIEYFHLDVTFWPALISAACATALLWMVFDLLWSRLNLNRWVVVLATLSLGCFPPFAVWSTSGLATMPFALLVFVTFERLVLRERGPDGIGGGVAGLSLALIRVEGVAWAAVILVLALISRRITRERCLRALLTFGLIIGIGFGAYFACRYSYYQMLLPNTAYAKGELDAARLLRGLKYVAAHELTFLTPILILPGALLALRRRRLAIGLPIAAMAWAFPAYAVVVTGDWMPMGRFLVPSFAFAAVLFAWILNDLRDERVHRRAIGAALGVGVIVLGLLPGWNVILMPESLRERVSFRETALGKSTNEYRRWRSQARLAERWAGWGRALRSYTHHNYPDEKQPSCVFYALGALGYYSDLYMYDLHGLVTPEVAHRTIDPTEPLRQPGHDKIVGPDFFLKDLPTILDLKVFQESDPRAAAAQAENFTAQARNAYAGHANSHRYGPDIIRIEDENAAGEATYMFLWRKMPDSTSPRGPGPGFRAKLAGMRAGRHLTTR